MKTSKWILVLAVGISLLLSSICFADTGANSGNTHGQVIYTYLINVSTATTTNISTSVIRPNVDKIVGVEILSTNTGSPTVSLWDETTNTVASGDEIICEAEATPYGPGILFFPFPRVILNQATVVQGANSTVIVYYIRN
jgi:hypothetical protein